MKLKTLKDQYRKERRRKEMPSGSAGGPVKKEWEYYHVCDGFLRPFIAPKRYVPVIMFIFVNLGLFLSGTYWLIYQYLSNSEHPGPGVALEHNTPESTVVH